MAQIPVRLYFFAVLTVAVFGLLFWGLGQALTPLVVAFGLAYLVFPLVARLEAKGIPRAAAVGGVFLLCLLVLGGLLVAIIPVFIREVKLFFVEVPDIAEGALNRIQQIVEDYGYAVEVDREWILEQVKQRAQAFSVAAITTVTDNVSGAFRGLLSWVLWILNLFLIPVFFFYVVNDYETLTSNTKILIPPRNRSRVMHYVTISNEILSGYIRGQVVVALILAVLYGAGLALVGLRFGLLVGILTGLFNIIPYVGFTLGILTAVIVAFAYSEPWTTFLGMGAVFMIVQMLESFVITPRLVGNKVGLSALAAMLALIVGGNLLGLMGMLLAIPAAAIIKAILAELKQEYLQMDFYKRQSPPPTLE